MKIFEAVIDSSVIIEALKGNKIAVDLFLSLKQIVLKKIYINNIVWSEIVYQLVFKRDFKKEEIFEILNSFFFFVIDEEVLEKAQNFVCLYNLRPNDALILATCKHYRIKYLISIDRNDFAIPCEKEGIVLIDSAEKLNKVFKNQ